MVGELTVIVSVVEIVTVAIALSEQLPLVAVTVYEVVDEGDTTIELVVSPVDQE